MEAAPKEHSPTFSSRSMRTIKWSTRFKKDVRRELRGRHGKNLQTDLEAVLTFLQADAPLPTPYRDHGLTGDLQDTRDCHLYPDLILLYRKPSPELLELARLGSHSELKF